MTAPVSSEYRGWYYDRENGTLDIYAGFGTGAPTEIARINATTFSLLQTFQPATNDGAALGTTVLGWSDLHLATGGVINWANGEVTLTEAANSLTMAGGDLIIATAFGLNVGSATQVTISDGDGATNLIPEGQFLGVGATDFPGGSILAATFNATNTRAVAPRIALVKGAAATQVATTAVADNEVVGIIIAHASDSADFETAVASIEAVVDDSGGPGAGAIGGSWEFYTTADGGETLTLAFTINSDQNTYFANNNGVVIGNGARITAGGAGTSELQVLGTDANDSSVLLSRNSADTGGPTLTLNKSRNATIGSFTIVSNGDDLGSIEWSADDGVDYRTPAASIVAAVDGTPGANDMPGRIVFSTTADGASTVTERLRINAAGNILAAAGAIFQSSAAGEIAFVVTNETLTIGSEGTVVIPYLSSTGGLFTDAIGGNLNGAIGVNLDTDTGPNTSTLEVRSNGSWLSVAVTGYLHQRDVPFGENANFWFHPDQLHVGPNAKGEPILMLDESRCVVCGEPLEVGDQATFYVNGANERGAHSVFGHAHLERDPYVQGLEARVRELETALAVAA